MGTASLGSGLCCLLGLTRMVGGLLSTTMGKCSGFFEAVVIYWVKACFIDKTILLYFKVLQFKVTTEIVSIPLQRSISLLTWPHYCMKFTEFRLSGCLLAQMRSNRRSLSAKPKGFVAETPLVLGQPIEAELAHSVLTFL